MEINETNEVSKASESNDEKAQELLDKGIPDAQQVIQDPSRMDVVMALLEDKLNKYPEIRKKLTDIPLMTAMLKAWEAKEYTEVSTKTVSRLVSAILYLVKENDLLWDNIPHVGLADDLAVLGLALKFSKRDLNAFSEWKAAQA